MHLNMLHFLLKILYLFHTQYIQLLLRLLFHLLRMQHMLGRLFYNHLRNQQHMLLLLRLMPYLLRTQYM
jgi:hypothetical protein